MPKFSFSVPQTLGKDTAKVKFKEYIERSREFFEKQTQDRVEDWSKWDANDSYSFSFKTFGFKISGEMTILEDAVKVDGDLPIAAMMFKGKVEEGFRDIVRRALS
jgi:hypothetical protein